MLVPTSRPSPTTRLFPVIVAAFAWYVHGVVWAVLALALFLAATFALNRWLRSRVSHYADPVQSFRRAHWLLLIIGMIAVAASGVTIGSVPA